MSEEAPYNDTGKAELRDRIAMVALRAHSQQAIAQQPNTTADACYEMADAMLKARERKEAP